MVYAHIDFSFNPNKTLGNELPTIFSKRELMKIIEEHAGAKEEEKECNKLVFAGSELF